VEVGANGKAVAKTTGIGVGVAITGAYWGRSACNC